MNILFIVHESSRTGAPLALLSLLKKMKVDIPHFSSTVLMMEDGPMVNDFRALGEVIVPRIKPWNLRDLFSPNGYRDRFMIRCLLLLFKNRHFNLIYANSVMSLDCAIVLKQNLGVPVLLHFHESSINLCYIHVSQTNIKQCDHYIAVSQKAHDTLVLLGAKEDKIHVVYPTSEFVGRLMECGDEMRVDNGKNCNSKFTIGFVGSLIERKGADMLPIVAKKLIDKYPECDFEILIVGNNHARGRKSLDYDSKRLGVIDKFRFVESKINPIPEYKEMDMLLMLSREESFSLVVLELGLLGRPSVLFEGSCGIQHFIQNNVNSILVPYLDTDAVVDALYRLYTDRDMCFRLGQQLKDVLTDYYTTVNTNDEIIRLLMTFTK